MFILSGFQFQSAVRLYQLMELYSADLSENLTQFYSMGTTSLGWYTQCIIFVASLICIYQYLYFFCRTCHWWHLMYPRLLGQKGTLKRVQKVPFKVAPFFWVSWCLLSLTWQLSELLIFSWKAIYTRLDRCYYGNYLILSW